MLQLPTCEEHEQEDLMIDKQSTIAKVGKTDLETPSKGGLLHYQLNQGLELV